MISLARWAVAAILAHQALAGGIGTNKTCDVAQKACEDLSVALPDRVSTAFTAGYYDERQSYWSNALKDVRPACFVVAESAQDVAVAVKVLRHHPEVDFAVKSGGHDPNHGHASIRGGVVISMTEMAGVTYDEETKLAHVKPGGDWDLVVGGLAEHGVTIAGGRLGIVGVGGLLLGGGMSFLSAQYGLAADSIVEWETVTADGSIVHVNAEKNPELAVAMRGSGGQFGIVTKFTVKTHPIGAKIWGGSRMYSEEQQANVWKALHDFVPENEEDPKAAIIPTNIIYNLAKIHQVQYYYDAPEPPTTGPLAKFLEIPSISDTTATRTYAELIRTNGEAGDPVPARQSFRTYTMPYIADAPHVYQEIWDKYYEIYAKRLEGSLAALLQCSLTFQPFPAIIGAHGAAAGGNAMGITGEDPDRLILEIQCAWDNKTDDATMYTIAAELADWVDLKMPEWTKGEPVGYMPLYLNDAAWDQDVMGSYRDYEKLKALQEKVDPEGFFSERAGGFKY